MLLSPAIFVSAFIIAIISFILGYFLSHKTNRFQNEALRLSEENDYLKDDIQEKQNQILALEKKCTNLEAENKFHLSRYDNSQIEHQKLQEQLDKIITEKENIIAEKHHANNQISKLNSENSHLRERLEEQRVEFLRLQDESKKTFENLAHQIFNEKTNQFTQKSEKTLFDVLNPVKQSFNEFQKLITDKFNIQTGEQLFLKEELKRILEVNEKMTFQADSLTKALKGDNKIMGNWGEIMLEKILEDSGLTKGTDYVLQSEGYKLKDESGKRQIPDAIIKLPDNKEIIIDAKVTLVDYERIIADIDNKAQYERQFLKSVKAHIDNLASKEYYHNDQLTTPDFVLMFMPIEGAYMLAMQLDQGLHHYAWNKRIALVSNTTLFATLRTVASLWRIEKQNKNAELIANRAGLIYDKFAGFIDDLSKVQQKIKEADKVLNDATDKLHNGRGNLINQVEELKTLGAKAKKSLPSTQLIKEDA